MQIDDKYSIVLGCEHYNNLVKSKQQRLLIFYTSEKPQKIQSVSSKEECKLVNLKNILADILTTKKKYYYSGIVCLNIISKLKYLKSKSKRQLEEIAEMLEFIRLIYIFK